MRLVQIAVLAAVFHWTTLPASSAMIGSTVGADFYYPDIGSPFCSNGISMVGGGVEFPISCPGYQFLAIDITDDQLIVNHTNLAGFSGVGSFNGFVLTLYQGFEFTSIAYNVALSTLGVTEVSLTDRTIVLNFLGQGSGFATFDVTNGAGLIDDPLPPVPLPAALPLLAGALAILGVISRMRHRRTKQLS